MAQNYPFECDVMVGTTPVGVLSLLENEDVSFRYNEDYVAHGGRSLSPHLPTTQLEHVSKGGLPPFFSNLLSEGWLRAHHDRALEIMQVEDALERDVVTDFDILAFLGTTALRGGRIRPRQRFPQKIWDKLNQLKQKTAASKSIIAGVQPKLFVRKYEDGVFHSCDPEDATHIAKTDFAEDDEKAHMRNMKANEFVTTAASRILTPEDEIAETDMADVWEFGPPQSLVSKRFDLANNGRAYRMLDFGQLLDIPPERRMDATFAQIAKFINDHADDHAGSHFKTDRRDIEKFARRVLRDILIGNYDTHLKNFSLMEKDGVWRLSPDYDLVHSRVYGDGRLALHIDMPTSKSCSAGVTPWVVEERERYKPSLLSLRHGKQICRLLTTLGIKRERQAVIIRELLENIPATREFIAHCPVGDDILKRSMLKNMDARRREDFEPALKLCERAIEAQNAAQSSQPVEPTERAKPRSGARRVVPTI